MSYSAQFWSKVNSTPSNADWIPLEKEYQQYQTDIDVNYPPNSDQTILSVTCLKKKMDLVDKMLFQKNADFTKGNIPLLVASAERAPILAHIIASNQNVDVNAGPQDGLTPYWSACNYKMWRVIHQIHRKYKVHPESAPKGCSPPFWLAANAREFTILTEMLYINPHCDLTFAPSSGSNKDKQALWFIFHSEVSKVRTAVLNIFIHLKAPLQETLPEIYKQEFKALKREQSKKENLSIKSFIYSCPELAGKIELQNIKV